MKRRVWMLAAVLLLLCSPVRADSAVTIEAQAGYGGVVIEGEWVPIAAQIHAEEQDFTGVVRVDVYQDSDTFDRMEMPVTVSKGETQSIRFSVLPQIRQRSFCVTLCDAEGEEVARDEAAWSRSIAQDALVIGAIGVDSELLESLRSAEIRDAHGRLETIGVLVLDENCLMETRDEMNALDTLLISESDLHMLSEKQTALLDEWENQGGVLLRGVGIEEMAQETEDMAQEDRQENAPPSAEEQAERLLERISQGLSSVSRSGDYSNYTFGSGLTQSLRTGEGRSIFPAAALLLIYIAGAGVGLYLICRRRDKGWMLWLAIPSASLLCTALVLVLSAYMKIDEPTAAQLHITVVDAQGSQWTEESATVSYAGQHRAEIAAQDGSAIERRTYAYYNDYSELNPQGGMMRDRITLGADPAIELASGADWLTRNLMIRSSKSMKGQINTSAWMEEDGFHVQISNDTEAALCNAFLLTEIGYAILGDLQPGETAHAFLERAQSVRTDKNGDFLIPPDTALPYSASIYQSIQALVDPEELTDEAFDVSKLSDKEQYERNILSSKLGLSNQIRQEGFACLLVADTPQIACAPLTIDGKPFEKTAAVSVLIKQIDFKERGPNGYFYYPQGSFAAYSASLDAGGKPVMSDKEAETYEDWERLPPCFGFRLDGVNAADVSEIRIFAQRYRKEDELCFEAYDAREGSWIVLEGGLRPMLDGDLLDRVLSESGELYLRYGGAEGDAAYRPEIIVEGRESK